MAPCLVLVQFAEQKERTYLATGHCLARATPVVTPHIRITTRRPGPLRVGMVRPLWYRALHNHCVSPARHNCGAAGLRDLGPELRADVAFFELYVAP